MKQIIKNIIKAILYFLHIDITRNQQYDRQTHLVMKRLIGKNTNCIDIGCHKGEMLEIILKLSPNGQHYAFEPIPYLNLNLKKKFSSHNIHISNIALSNVKGTSTFNHVKNAPAFSGLKKRIYTVKHPEIEELKVDTDLLDNILPQEYHAHFIKIDVEGAEYPVLQGAKNTLLKYTPTIIFEFGLGGSDFYGTTPEMIFNLLVNECGLKIYTLKNFLKGNPSLSLEELISIFEANIEYYFIATS